MDLYIFLGMCTELMNTTYVAADHTVYLNSAKMTIAEREPEYQRLYSPKVQPFILPVRITKTLQN